MHEVEKGFARPHRQTEADGLGFHLFSLLDPMVAGIGVYQRLVLVKQLCSWSQFMHVGRRRLERVNQAVVLGHANRDFHPEVTLVPLLRLVHHGIPFVLLVHDGAGRVNQGGSDDRALIHGHSVGLKVSLHRLKDLFAEIVLHQQVAEAEDRVFIGILSLIGSMP